MEEHIGGSSDPVTFIPQGRIQTTDCFGCSKKQSQHSLKNRFTDQIQDFTQWWSNPK